MNTLNKLVPDWLRIGMNISMLGMINKNIRLITVEYDEIKRFINICSYLDREINEDDKEDMEILITELWSMMGQYFDDADFKCIYSTHTQKELNMLNGAVFRRKE